MNYEDAHRNVTNLVAQYASLVDMLPTLEKARDAENFLNTSEAQIQSLNDTIATLTVTAFVKKNEVAKAIEARTKIQGDIQQLVADRSSLKEAYIRDSAQYTADTNAKKSSLDSEVQALVSQHDQLKAELVSVSKSIQSARAVEQSLKDNIKKANAALAAAS